jgi:hypothetical protein
MYQPDFAGDVALSPHNPFLSGRRGRLDFHGYRHRALHRVVDRRMLSRPVDQPADRRVRNAPSSDHDPNRRIGPAGVVSSIASSPRSSESLSTMTSRCDSSMSFSAAPHRDERRRRRPSRRRRPDPASGEDDEVGRHGHLVGTDVADRQRVLDVLAELVELLLARVR